LKPKKGQKLGDLPGLDKGIAFCTYDLLVRSGGAFIWGEGVKRPGFRV
jgi:hypothetical protein